MTRSVDDRTQVQLVTLRTEAELLKSWMAHRDAVALRRRQGPLEALEHRHRLLDREVPRLELEVARLEKTLGRSPPGATSAFASGLLRGLLFALAAGAWIVGVTTLTREAHVHDPARVVAVVLTVVVVVLVRMSQEARS
ncbi:MAG: hypothetical protein JNJ54_02200 [Myxococcaceae bacterium]|nr:hypothetical protein [Myxococcaceae bacterium]